MTSILNPYISFRDNAREALEFYHSVFGGQLHIMTFGDAGITDYPGEEGKVMHGFVGAENGMKLMASDTPNSMQYAPGSQISISLSGPDTEELTAYWNALSERGTIIEPLTLAPWGDAFGMTLDPFGITWMVNIVATPASGA